MAHSEEVWNKIKLDYEIHGISFDKLAKNHPVSKTGIIKRAKKYGWVKNKSNQDINDIILIEKEKSRLVSKKSNQYTSEEIVEIDSIVNHQLEMEGLYNYLEKGLVCKAIEQLNKHKPKTEDAVDNIVKLTSALKNIKPPVPKAVIKNTVNTADTMTLDERKQEFMNILKAYD